MENNLKRNFAQRMEINFNRNFVQRMETILREIYLNALKVLKVSKLNNFMRN